MILVRLSVISHRHQFKSVSVRPQTVGRQCVTYDGQLNDTNDIPHALVTNFHVVIVSFKRTKGRKK